MKSYLLLIVLLLISCTGFSQSKKELQQQVNSLTSENQRLLNEKMKLMEDILNLKQQILDIKTENLNYKTENDKLQSLVSPNSSPSANPSNSAISTQSTSPSQTSNGRCLALTQAGLQCSRTAQTGSKYCWQHQSYAGTDANSVQNFKNSSGTTKSSGSSTSSGRTIMTGPRGGQYYINKNGNKTYIKKK